MDLKAISCRIEWSLFQVHSTKHARDNFYNKFDHKVTIVALWTQRVNCGIASLNLMLGHTLLNQACASHRPAYIWFFERLYVCLCVSAPEAINN